MLAEHTNKGNYSGSKVDDKIALTFPPESGPLFSLKSLSILLNLNFPVQVVPGVSSVHDGLLFP